MPTTSSQAAPVVAEVAAPLLEVRDLEVHFPINKGWFGAQTGAIRAVDGVSFTIAPGETLGLVGESGCGKSTTARAIVGLAKATAGEIHLEGQRVDELTEAGFYPLRRKVQMIFQDPYASLNPRMTIGDIIAEPMHVLGVHSPQDRKFEVLKLLEMVGLNPRYLNRYPHEFSGGQRQRVGIARALAADPRLIICDEPVSALDVSIQAQVVNLLLDLQQKLGLSYLLIAHDLAVVRHTTDRVAVMYLGRIVEIGPKDDVYENPRHPYTQALLSAAPIADPEKEKARQRIVLRGEVPSPDKVYQGCPFADRCFLVEDRCRVEPQPLRGTIHPARCWKAPPE